MNDLVGYRQPLDGFNSRHEVEVQQSRRLQRLNTKAGQAISVLLESRTFLFPSQPTWDSRMRQPTTVYAWISRHSPEFEVGEPGYQLIVIDQCITSLRRAKRAFARSKWHDGAIQLKVANDYFESIFTLWPNGAGAEEIHAKCRRLRQKTRDIANDIALLTDLVEMLGVDLQSGASS